MMRSQSWLSSHYLPPSLRVTVCTGQPMLSIYCNTAFWLHVQGAEAQELAFLIDKYISHKLMFCSLMGILALFILADRKSEITHKELFVSSAVIFGISLMISTVEGRTGYEALAFLIVILAIWLLRRIRGEEQGLFLRYMMIASIAGIAISFILDCDVGCSC